MGNKVLVIGGGAAGVRAACAAAELGAEVTLFERNERIGRKVRITGKGRCNLTNYRPDINEFVRHVPVNGRFLYSALSRFGPLDTMALFEEELGVPLRTERGNRVFPVSDKATDIVDAMDRDLRRHRVRRVQDRIVRILTEDGKAVGVEGEHCGQFTGAAVILATGGMSYPKTGSTGDGYRMAEVLGHTVTPLSPSLVPMTSADPCCHALQGLALRNVGIQVIDPKNGTKIYEDFGEMEFTYFGVSGPVIRSASSHIRSLSHPLQLTIDLKPALDEQKLDRRIQREFSADPNRLFRDSLGKLLPKKMIPVMVERSNIAPDKPLNQVTREEREHLVRCFKQFGLMLNGFRPVTEAIITSGGVSTREIDPHTMESRLVPGLFFAGEIIDVDGYTGGYNLQIAFSTGTLAGENAAYAALNSD